MPAKATEPRPAPAAPSFLELEITGFCQLNCAHCYADSGPRGGHGAMTADDWEDVITQAAAMGVKTVQFIGGEPTLHPALPRLVRHAFDCGLNINVYSNLVRITVDLWELFSTSGLALSTSWYAADQETHASITGSRVAYAATRANIARAIQLGIPVCAAIIVIRPGQDAAAAEAELRALGAAHIRIRDVQGVGRAARDGHGTDPAELCGNCGIDRVAILPDGQLTPCVIGRWLNCGNVRETPLTAILAGPAWQRALAAVPRRSADCPPANDGNDCPPASNDACGPDYCAPDGTSSVFLPLARAEATR